MFCGFNEKMLKGLNEFNEGLVEHGLMFNSKKNNESIEQAIRREISDMTRLLTETHRIDDSSKRLMTEGLVQYVMYFLFFKFCVCSNQKLVLDYQSPALCLTAVISAFAFATISATTASAIMF